MRSIWKKILSPYDAQEVELPTGSTIVAAGMQGDDMCIWFDVPDTSADRETVTIYVRGTGHGVPAKASYAATVMMESLVFHIFQKDAS